MQLTLKGPMSDTLMISPLGETTLRYPVSVLTLTSCLTTPPSAVISALRIRCLSCLWLSSSERLMPPVELIKTQAGLKYLFLKPYEFRIL